MCPRLPGPSGRVNIIFWGDRRVNSVTVLNKIKGSCEQLMDELRFPFASVSKPVFVQPLFTFPKNNLSKKKKTFSPFSWSVHNVRLQSFRYQH